MPDYGYVCENNTCQYEFEIKQKMVDDALTLCPKCKHRSLIRKIYAPIVICKGEPTKLGHLAARNTEKMGHYEYEEKVYENRKKRIKQASEKILKATGGKNIEHDGTLPWWRSGEVPGLDKKERPIKQEEADKISKDLSIIAKEPPKR